MPTPNWVTLSGDVLSRVDSLTYTPVLFSDGPNAGEPMVAVAKSSAWFQQGVIEFKLVFSERYTSCAVILDEFQTVQVSIGGMIPGGPQFAIQRLANNQWSILGTSGSADLLAVDTEILVRIVVTGSFIELYIDDVRVLFAIYQLFRSQVAFQFIGKSKVEVRSIKVSGIKPTAFIVMQFGADYDALYSDVIQPVCEELGIDAIRGDEIYSTNSILADITQSIRQASVIVADITPDNANVFYELGYAHAINKPTILMCETRRPKLPFDISGFRTIFYENSIPGKSLVEAKLRKHLHSVLGQGVP